jgi:hypothetical protein
VENLEPSEGLLDALAMLFPETWTFMRYGIAGNRILTLAGFLS